MTEQNLIINGVDHAKFDLEWAKRGGIVKTDDNRFIQFTQAGYVGGDWGWFIDLSTKEMKTAILYSELDYDSELDEFHIDRMATPQECEDAGVEYIEPQYAELEELRKDRDLLQFCLDNDTFPVKDQSGAYIMSKNNEFFSVSDSPRKSIELAFEYVKFKADNAMRGEK